MAKDGEHELRYDRFSTSAGGCGSCRGKQRSRRAVRGEVGETGNQAAGAIGSIPRRAVFNVGLCGDSKFGLIGDEDDASLHLLLLLADVHVEEKLEPG